MTRVAATSRRAPLSPKRDYAAFLARKTQLDDATGFEPLWIPDFLFLFQRALVEWAVRQGRAALFADCGLEAEQETLPV